MLGVVLLYVGVVLIVNGIWLVGAANVAAAAKRVPAMESAAFAAAGGGRGLRDEAAGQEIGGEAIISQSQRSAEAKPWYIQNREVAILNVFTGFIGVAVAITFIVQGGTATVPEAGLASIRAGALILLFAFTYLWVAYNQYANAGGRALGWYSLFVAVTAVVAGVYTIQNTPGTNTANLWLAGSWFAWAVLWAMFWGLLSLELPIARITGYVAIIEGIGTSWAFAIALLWGKVTLL